MAGSCASGRRRGGAPAWFLARLPRQALDGELWLGHGRFDEVSALLRRGDPDGPGLACGAVPGVRVARCPGRVRAARQQIEALVAATAWPQLVAVAQRPMADATALQQWLDEVVAAGGEGLVLHRADAPTRRAGPRRCSSSSRCRTRRLW
jgi:DNA ligase-1